MKLGESPELSATEFERLAAEINLAAAPVLAARRRQSWLDELVDWSRLVIPLAVAAGVAAVLLLSSSRREPAYPTEQVAAVEAPETLFLSAVSGGASGERVIEATLPSYEEHWRVPEVEE